jgi:hypothetical protein
MRKLAVVLVLAVLCPLLLGAKKSQPVKNAPDALPHTMALFLASMSKDGTKTVTFRATARDTYFFFEEPSGVTVYVWDQPSGAYRRSEFIKASTLPKAIKRYEANFVGTK